MGDQAVAKWHIENIARVVPPKRNQGHEWAIAYCGLYFNLYKRRVRDDTCKRCITMRGLLMSHEPSHNGNGYRWVGIMASKPAKLPKRIMEKEFGLSE